MNCKQGDLARVIDHEWSRSCGFVDKIVRVLCASEAAMYWRIDQLYHGRDVHMHDSLLRPIRDPGDDAKDEMLRPLPKEVTA